MVKAEDIDFGDDADRIYGVGLFVVVEVKKGL